MQAVGIKMQSTTVSGQFSMFFTVIIVGGMVIAFPYVFWEFWSFIKPGLTTKESSRTKGVIFWVSLLFFLGIAFGYFILAPYTVNFFGNFQLDENIENRWSIGSYIDTLVPLILGTGLAFQLPLAMLFLTKIGVVSPSYLRRVRKYAIVIIVIIAGIITPPDVVSQIIVSVPLLLLYEVSILLSARVVRRQEEQDLKEWS
jgi:sec-independent protein translocase protein TatC